MWELCDWLYYLYSIWLISTRVPRLFLNGLLFVSHIHPSIHPSVFILIGDCIVDGCLEAGKSTFLFNVEMLNRQYISSIYFTREMNNEKWFIYFMVLSDSVPEEKEMNLIILNLMMWNLLVEPCYHRIDDKLWKFSII